MRCRCWCLILRLLMTLLPRCAAALSCSHVLHSHMMQLMSEATPEERASAVREQAANAILCHRALTPWARSGCSAGACAGRPRCRSCLQTAGANLTPHEAAGPLHRCARALVELIWSPCALSLACANAPQVQMLIQDLRAVSSSQVPTHAAATL
jgi:hypothetical protein